MMSPQEIFDLHKKGGPRKSKSKNIVFKLNYVLI